MAQRGYSRDRRPDRPQVCIGLVVTTDGIPLGYEVFDGNTNDSTTVQTIVKAMEEKYGRADRVWVMDRGMVSEKNLQFLRDRGGAYIVGTPKGMLRQFERHLSDKDWHEVQAGVEVKLVPGPDGAETFILARSADRREKEKAMHNRFVERMEAKLEKMQAGAESGRLRDLNVAHQRLGRLKERFWRAAGAFDVKIATIPHPAGKARLSITGRRNTRWTDWTALSEGCYLLRTNPPEADRSSHPVEALHSAHGGGVGLPHHERRTEDPADLAPEGRPCEGPYPGLLPGLCSVEGSGSVDARGWSGRCPRTLVEELAKIKSGDVVLPARWADGTERTVHLRCVTTPDEAQKVLLNRLGLTLPQRLRRIDEVAQM